jgi:hypothetical protein
MLKNSKNVKEIMERLRWNVVHDALRVTWQPAIPYFKHIFDIYLYLMAK